MTYDGLVLAAVVAELGRSIQGGVIQHIRQHSDSDFTFEVRSRGRTYRLFLSVNARFARIYTTASSQPVPQVPPNFCMLLRKYLKGSFIKSIEQVGFDRVLRIRTEAPDGNRNILMFELMGKHSNLILLSDSEIILGAAKFVSAAVSRYRQVLPGRNYIPPPGAGKADPITVIRDEFNELWREGLAQEVSSEDIKRWLVAAFSGIGPFLAEEIMLCAESTDSDAVWRSLQSLREIVTTQDYAPVFITNDRGAAFYAYPVPVGQFSSENQHARYSINETLDTLYRDLIRRDRFDTEFNAIELAIRRSIAWREQSLKDIQKAITEGGKAERYKQYGELILASAASIKKGETIAKVVDYYNPEMKEIEIPLDEKLSTQENAERYFRRYRKAIEGANAAADRQKEFQEEIKELKSAAEKLPSIESIEDIQALREMLTQKGLLRPEPLAPVPGKREEPEFGTARIRRVTSSNGFEILYGENSQSNDYLTSKVAKPNDLWFHARSVTGAHVVIRTGNRPDLVPRSTIMQAAEIAARNSDAKHSRLVAVDYTLKKYVRKPKGSPPGFVRYQQEKTIDVVPDVK